MKKVLLPHLSSFVYAILLLVLLFPALGYAMGNRAFTAEVNIPSEITHKMEDMKTAANTVKEATQHLGNDVKEASNTLASIPGKLDKLIEERLPQIDAMLAHVVGEAEKSGRNLIQDAGSEVTRNIRLASSEAKERIKQAGDEARGLLKEMTQLADGLMDKVDARLQIHLKKIKKISEEFLHEVDKIVNGWIDKIDEKVRGWLEGIEKIANLTSDTLWRFQLENERLTENAKTIIPEAIVKVDEMTEKNVHEAKMILARAGKHIETLKGLGFGEKTPTILGIYPGPVFVKSDAPKTITISTIHFQEKGEWCVELISYIPNQKPLSKELAVKGEIRGFEEILIWGDFIKDLKPEYNYALKVTRSYIKEEKSWIGTEVKKVEVKSADIMPISIRTQPLDFELVLQIKDTKDNTIFPPDQFQRIPIKDCHSLIPLFSIDVSQNLPLNINEFSLHGELKNINHSTGFISGKGALLSLRLDDYQVDIKIEKMIKEEPYYRTFKTKDRKFKGEAATFLQELKQSADRKAVKKGFWENREHLQDFLTYLSFRTGLLQAQDDYVPYFKYYINPHYIVYINVIGKK